MKKLNKKDLTPKEIIHELDRYIIGQKQAKKSVALALRNRWRRLRVSKDLRDEITPKNIIMIGPTGVGKTEIARRISKMVNAPFIKVEASKYTEVGYVGRDVESMVRDLTETAALLIRQEMMGKVKKKARENAVDRVLEVLIPPSNVLEDENRGTIRGDEKIKETFRKKITTGKLDEKMIDITMREKAIGSNMEIIPIGIGGDNFDMNIKDMVNNFLPKQEKTKRMTVAESLRIFEQDEAEKLIEREDIHGEATKRVEMNGIIFLDEIDKITGKSSSHSGVDVSREGVQRDLLPIVEGCSVHTKYGPVKTDHILFIAAGAFHGSKPSDLIPELQGRFPIRVELEELSKSDFIRILAEPDYSLVRQYTELLKTEKVDLIIKRSAIEKIAELAYQVNSQMENIGARRLHTIMEKLLEDISFEAPDKSGECTVDAKYVTKKLSGIIKDQDLSQFIL